MHTLDSAKRCAVKVRQGNPSIVVDMTKMETWIPFAHLAPSIAVGGVVI
jgi:hypothetical protein